MGLLLTGGCHFLLFGCVFLQHLFDQQIMEQGDSAGSEDDECRDKTADHHHRHQSAQHTRRPGQVGNGVGRGGFMELPEAEHEPGLQRQQPAQDGGGQQQGNAEEIEVVPDDRAALGGGAEVGMPHPHNDPEKNPQDRDEQSSAPVPPEGTVVPGGGWRLGGGDAPCHGIVECGAGSGERNNGPRRQQPQQTQKEKVAEDSEDAVDFAAGMGEVVVHVSHQIS